MTKDEMIHYVAQIVIHEAAATSTNDRMAYWTAVAQLLPSEGTTFPQLLLEPNTDKE